MTTKHNSSGGGSVSIAPPVTAGNYTLTLPAATTTLVGTDFAQTLSNKTLDTTNVAVTQAGTDNSTKIATTAMVQAALKQSGKVLKVQSYVDSGSNTASTSTINLNQSGWNFTPTSTNSKIIIIVSGQFGTSGYAATVFSYLYIGELIGSWTTISNAYAIQSLDYSSGYSEQIYAPGCLQVALNNTSLTTRVFDVMGVSGAAGLTLYANNFVATIIEVAN